MKKSTKEYLPLIIDVEEFLKEKGIKFKPNSTGELIMDDCYNCHRAKKLYVSKEKGTFICFKCGETGGPSMLISKYLDIPFKEAFKICHGKSGGIVKSSIQAVKEEDEEEESMPFLSLGGLKKSGVVSELKMPEPITIPPEFKLLTETSHPEAWKYMVEKRGYKEEELPMLKLMILPYHNFLDVWKVVQERLKKEKPELSLPENKELLKNEIVDVAGFVNRVIFPVYIEGQVMGLVARDITDQDKLKVKNSKGNFRTFSVWNFDNAKYSDELIACEGNSSANKCGLTRSIALLGKKATPPQIQLLKKTKAKKFYTCLDVGTDKEQIALCQAMMIRFPGQVYRIILPPHIGYKKYKSEINSELVSKIQNDHGVTIELFDNYFKILPDQKEKLKKMYLNADFDKLFGEKAGLMEYLIKDCEYLDAGDYSFEEMEAFKQAAILFTGAVEIDD